MELLVHQILSGLATGGIYASVALALVMIYQATHLVNFAQGEMAMFATYLAWTLMQAGVPYWGAFFITVAAAFVVGVLLERIVIQPVENAPILSVVIVFIGLLVIFNSVAGWIYSYTIKPFPSPFPQNSFLDNKYLSSHDMGSALVTLVVLALVFVFFRYTPLGLAMRAAAQNPVSSRLVGVRVGWMLALGWGLASAIGAVGVTLVVLALLYLFFRYTPLGLAMRAAAQNPDSSRLVGIRVGWMLALGWGLASAIGAIAGMMVAPVVYLDPNMMAGILLYAFAAALVGGIDSPGGAVLGGFIVGVLENLLGAYVIGNELKLSVALVLIIGVLVVRPSGLFGEVHVSRV